MSCDVCHGRGIAFLVPPGKPGAFGPCPKCSRPVAPISAEALAPRPERISQFVALHWEGLTDEEVRAHAFGVAKAYTERVGAARALVDLVALARFVRGLPGPQEGDAG